MEKDQKHTQELSDPANAPLKCGVCLQVSPELAGLLLEKKLRLCSALFFIVGSQAFLYDDSGSFIFHWVTAISLFGVDCAFKLDLYDQTALMAVTLGVYPPILLFFSPLQFVYSLVLSCSLPLLSLNLASNSSHRLMYLVSSVLAWTIYAIYSGLLGASPFERNTSKAFWSQFALLYSLSVSYAFWVLCSSQPKNDENEHEAVTTVDLRVPSTKPQSMEAGLHHQLTQVAKQNEDFILRFSHEIRNPLNSLLGNIDLALESLKESEVKEMISNAKVSGEILLQLLNNILDSSKIDSKRLEISPVDCNIREYIEKVWLITHEIIRKKGIYGSIHLSGSLPTYMKIDPHRIMQIMLNMTTNAAKFTDKGSVKWHIDYVPKNQFCDQDLKPKYFSLHPGDEAETDLLEIDEKYLFDFEVLDTNRRKLKNHSGSFVGNSSREELQGYLRLEIVDSGCGMTATSVANIFKKFEQVSEESSKRQIGTGLGLWITKEIVEMMNGKIEAYSIKNFGTCFVIVFETEALPKNASIFKVPTLRTLPSLICKKALLLDNCSENQDIMRRYLMKCNIDDIILVPNEEEAVELFKKKGPGYFHIIVVHLELLVGSNDTAVKLIREHEKHEGWKPAKIIVVSSENSEETRRYCLNKHGPIRADVFLVKPVSLALVQKAIEDVEKMNIQNQTVLVAEDDYFNLSLLGNFLEKMGVTCLKASNGEEAMRIYSAQSDRISLILMDCEMPVVDGFTATREILKKQTLLNRSANIFGLTGHTEEKYRQRCKEAGMQDMLTKPIDFQRLKQLIIKELSRPVNNVSRD